MRIILIVCLISIFEGIGDTAPRCVIDGSESACKSVNEWKENLLCRIQGPPDETGQRVGGYFTDSIPKPDDNVFTVSMKLRAQRIFATMSVVLNSEWIYQNPYAAVQTLAMYETITTRVGRNLYGVNWVVSSKPCGINGKAVVLCGDKGISLPPSSC